jgi:hypothetical protein
MRYVLTRPVSFGYAYFNVVDTQSKVMPNFAVATFYRDMPDAGEEAIKLCERLNARDEL